MSAEYHSMGEVLPDLSPYRLKYEDSRQLLAACHQHSAFDVVELRRREISGNAGQSLRVVDGIVVECCDGTVPSRNLVGLKNRERLLLLHGFGLPTPYEVRALRQSFPTTPHQNHVTPGESASLCLYFESWSGVERTWTPAKHLQRILWWLRETALGTLHRSDQPLERLYFVSPYQIVLPADFNKRAANQSEILRLAWAGSRENGTLLRGIFMPKNVAVKADANVPGLELDSVVIEVPLTTAICIEQYSATLGGLHDQLVSHGSEFVASLVNAVKNVVPSAGLPIHNTQVKNSLLLLRVPLVREKGTAYERTNVTGFIVHANLARLSISCGAAFDDKNGKAYVDMSIIGATDTLAAQGRHSRFCLP